MKLKPHCQESIGILMTLLHFAAFISTLNVNLRVIHEILLDTATEKDEAATSDHDGRL
jgi:hypothetical protein